MTGRRWRSVAIGGTLAVAVVANDNEGAIT